MLSAQRSAASQLKIIALALACGALTLSVVAPSLAAEATEAAAEKLIAATVTVRIAVAAEVPAAAAERISEPKTEPKSEQKSDANTETKTPRRPAEEITVCSGVSLGEGLIVTFFTPPGDLLSRHPRVRVTLPGGEQAEATIRVVDRYSNLLLLEIANKKLPGLMLAETPPKVGSAVLSAAAAGIEQPAVSLGIVAANERSVAGSDLPPVMQCDLRTTETSSGAAVINSAGQLLGIIAATSPAGPQANGWGYAISARHVERLVRSKVDGKTLELKRTRPMVGLTLGAGEAEGVVRVERVQADGPAAAAGIAVGDVVLETDEIKIRSAYQAVDLILKKQPGDSVRLLVERGGVKRAVEIRLAGGSAPLIASLPRDNNLQVGSPVKATVKNGKIAVQGGDHATEVAVDPKAGPRRSPGDEVEMLRIQLQAFERVLTEMQKENLALKAENTRLKQQSSPPVR